MPVFDVNALAPGWYVVRTNTGYSGIVLHHGAGAINLGPAQYGKVTSASYIGNSSQDLPSIIGSRAGVTQALSSLGATPAQVRAFMVQADTAAGKEQGHPQGGFWGFVTGLVGATPFIKGKQTTQLLISGGRTPKPSASSGTTPVSTTPSGDIQSVGVFGPDFFANPLDFLKFIAWLFHPINLLRMVEFLTGMALILYGINTLIKGTMRSGRTHRTNLIGGLVKTFVPESRIAARAGRKAGRRQGARDVAYREARREVLRGSSNPPIEKRVRDGAE